jgi:cytoskeletal protein CcmA (bactofilin family)
LTVVLSVKNKEIVVKTKGNLEFGRGGELNTIIGKGAVINGDIQIQNSLRIDGKVKGNVVATDTVVIGKEGVVEGQVRAKRIFIAGKIQGNILASGKVFLEAKATILGDISASCLVVHEGALFDGKCVMTNGAVQKERKSVEMKDELKL